MKWRLSIVYLGVLLMSFVGTGTFAGTPHNEEPAIVHFGEDYDCSARHLDTPCPPYEETVLADVPHTETRNVQRLPLPPPVKAKRFLVLCSILV